MCVQVAGLHGLFLKLCRGISIGCFLLLPFGPLHHIPVSQILVVTKFLCLIPTKAIPFIYGGRHSVLRNATSLPATPLSIQEYPGRWPLELLLLTAYVLASRGRRNTSYTQRCAKELSVMWNCSISVVPKAATASYMCLVHTEIWLAGLTFYFVPPETATWRWWLLCALFVPFPCVCVLESEGEEAAACVLHRPWASLLFLH